jgi:small subunit ribosomal protein S15e
MAGPSQASLPHHRPPQGARALGRPLIQLRRIAPISPRPLSALPQSVGAAQKVAAMADEAPKKRTFRKYTYRGVDLDQLLDMSTDQLVELYGARQRRRFQRGMKRNSLALIKKLRKARKEASAGEKPDAVRTHLRNMIVIPEMIGSVVGVYNGKTFNQVEVKPDMVGHYLAEFSITYKPCKHGRPGIGATHSSRFIPLK